MVYKVQIPYLTALVLQRRQPLVVVLVEERVMAVVADLAAAQELIVEVVIHPARERQDKVTRVVAVVQVLRLLAAAALARLVQAHQVLIMAQMAVLVLRHPFLDRLFIMLEAAVAVAMET